MNILLAGRPFEIRFRHRHYHRVLTIRTRRYKKVKERRVIGYTQVKLYTRTQYPVHICTAGAWCSEMDEFDPAVGRQQAFRHLLERLNLGRYDRARMWEQYWEWEEGLAKRGISGTKSEGVAKANGECREETEEVEASDAANGSGVSSQQTTAHPTT